jgi:hypothetical protein
MDLEEETGDVTLLVLSTKGERRGSRGLKSRLGDDGPEYKGIDILNCESVTYGGGNPDGDIDIYETQPGEM